VHLDRKLERMLTVLLRLKERDVLPSRADPFGKSQSRTQGPSWPGIACGRARRISSLPAGRFSRFASVLNTSILVLN
jgi:hypothetical protein